MEDGAVQKEKFAVPGSRSDCVMNSHILILSEFRLVVVTLVNPAWGEDGCGEVVFPDDVQSLRNEWDPNTYVLQYYCVFVTGHIGPRRLLYLVSFQHSSDHISAGEHVYSDVDVGLAALEPTVVLHFHQVFLRPVVVGEETVAGVKKHPNLKYEKQWYLHTLT